MTKVNCIHKHPEAEKKRIELKRKLCKTFQSFYPDKINIHDGYSEINKDAFFKWLDSPNGRIVLDLTSKQYHNHIKRLTEKTGINCRCSKPFTLTGFTIEVK